jgi:hypothetical protein
MTFGETLINAGVCENPKLQRANTLFVELVDILETEYRLKNLGSTPLSNVLYENALCKLVDAHLSLTKTLSLK